MDRNLESFLNCIRKRLYRRLHALARPLAELADVLWPPAEPAASGAPDVPGDPDVPDAPAVSGIPKPRPSVLCSTDGRQVFWNRQVLEALSAEEADNVSETFLLHQVIHCLLGHPFSMPRSCPLPVWSLTCDLAAWHVLGVWTPELLPEGVGRLLTAVSEESARRSGGHPDRPLYRAPALAEWLEERGSGERVRLQNALLGETSFSDDHGLWPVFRTGGGRSVKRAGNGGGAEGDDGEGRRPGPQSRNQKDAEPRVLWDRLGKLLAANGPLPPETERGKKAGGRGEQAGGARYFLRLTDTRRHDYRTLLKSLARWGEEMKLNDSEFQYAPYLYGLEHYGGMPLLEPLEYEETARIRELAVIIDTSASCSRPMTQAFLEETRNLLLEEDLFFHPFNLHVIQCDREVRRDDKLTSPEDLKDYVDTLEICGMGGTDFRPAFAHVRQLQDRHEFTDLSAILFFTDGSGLYPEEPPETRTVFIFLNGHYEAIDVPDWAEILVLETGEPKD